MAGEAHRRDILINVVDEAELSSAIVPAIVDRDPLVIAVGTEGEAPVLAQGIRSRLETELPPFGRSLRPRGPCVGASRRLSPQGA